MEERRNWTRQELIIAFNLYCKLSFGQYHQSNKEIIELSKILHRTPSSVSLKLCNFARFDPALRERGVKGMMHGSKLDEVVWNEFNNNWDELAYQSEVALAELKGQDKEDLLSHIEELPEGRERDVIVKARVNQNFFRQMILVSYNSRCAICALPEERLLVASHIVPWSENKSLRMNPQNGICMCNLHDKAFDTGLISINKNYELLFSGPIKRLSHVPAIQKSFLEYQRIVPPERFLPDPEFILYHRKNIFLDK